MVLFVPTVRIRPVCRSSVARSKIRQLYLNRVSEADSEWRVHPSYSHTFFSDVALDKGPFLRIAQAVAVLSRQRLSWAERPTRVLRIGQRMSRDFPNSGLFCSRDTITSHLPCPSET